MTIDQRVDAPFSGMGSLECNNDGSAWASVVELEDSDSEFSVGVTDAMRQARVFRTTDAHVSRLSDAEFARRYPRDDLAITMAAIYHSRNSISLG